MRILLLILILHNRPHVLSHSIHVKGGQTPLGRKQIQKF